MAYEPRTKRQHNENRLKKHYDFRYNTILGRVEWKTKKESKFEPLNDYSLNSMIRFLDKEYNEAPSPDMLFQILKSDFTMKYNPIIQYFHEWEKEHKNHSGTKFIDSLAATVIVDNPQTFKLALTKWLVAAVAQTQATDGTCKNQTCIVFTGAQGAFKTTWLNNLCPPKLSEYLFSGKINLSLENKDVFIMLGEKFIINLDDQLRNLIKKDSETMKTLITQGKVSVRRPHAKLAEDIPRLASFVASINGEDFLSEDENRRFLPFKVKAIDIQAAQLIDMDGVWFDAYQLYKSKYQYWWTKPELAEHFGDMQDFKFTNMEYEMLIKYFDIVKSTDTPHELLNASDIINYLSAYTKERLSPNKLGAALATLQAIKRNDNTRNGIKCYCLNYKNLQPAPKALTF